MPRPRNNERDPREDAGIIRAVRKANLETEMRRYDGTHGEFAQMIGVGRQTLDGWVRGTKRMSNESVIEVAHILKVSPLYVLGLCGRYESDSPHAEASRSHVQRMVDLYRAKVSSGADPYAEDPDISAMFGNTVFDQWSQWIKTLDDLKEYLVKMTVDYRDLRILAKDTAEWYVSRLDGKWTGSMVSCIAEFGRPKYGTS